MRGKRVKEHLFFYGFKEFYLCEVDVVLEFTQFLPLFTT